MRIGPATLYDYFAPVMRADTSVGGTYRQWLETESALSEGHRGSRGQGPEGSLPAQSRYER